jgi:Phytanoyl-CoA dioxygenase (PhyH)
MRRTLDRFGAVLLRGAISRDVAAKYLDAVNDLYARDRLGKIAGLPESERAALDRGDIWPNAFNQYSDLIFEDYFTTSKLLRLVGQMLVKPRLYNQTILTVGSGANGGIGFHTDGIVQGTREAVVAMWSPLHRCGIDAPGLCIIPAPREKVVAYLQRAFPDKEIPGWCSHTEWGSAFHPADIAGEFGPPWTPEMQPGDVMVFTNWTIHGSHMLPGKRSAIVQRWAADRWQPTLWERLRGH